MYKEIWSENVKSLLHERGLTIAQAAEMLGTSRQYLSAILAEGEPRSAKEAITENLHWLLHTNPSGLYKLPCGEVSAFAGGTGTKEADLMHLSPVETAILAEQSFRGGHYRRAHAIAESLLGNSQSELVPAALAQAHLLSGKSACLAGDFTAALPRLKAALAFYRKRLSGQAEKYFSLCIDSYRYYGLAFYLKGDYAQASRQLLSACRLAEQYPQFAADVATRLEEAAANLLRAASRQGSRSALEQASSAVASMAGKCGFWNLTHYVTLELALAQYLERIVHGGGVSPAADGSVDFAALLRLSRAGYESLQGYTYILMLFLTGDRVALETVLSDLNREARGIHSGAAALTARFLYLLGVKAPGGAQPTGEISEPGIFAALQSACEAESLSAPEISRLRHHLWQETLGSLREEREFPLYMLTLHWHLRDRRADDLPQVAEIYRRMLETTCAGWEGR